MNPKLGRGSAALFVVGIAWGVGATIVGATHVALVAALVASIALIGMALS